MIKSISHQKTLLILFLEGFVSVSLQIFIMRQIVPFVGTSVVVMSLVVGIFLASLAVGYIQGGRHKKKHISILFRNLFISAFLISVFFSYKFMDFVFSYLQDLIGILIIEVCVFLIFALTPVIFLLGQTIPILTNFLKQNRISELTGLALSINTVGSVFGSFVTSLVFFYFFGMAITVFINVCLLAILMFMISSKNELLKTSFFVIPILLLSYFINVDFERSKFVLTTGYTNYEVKNYEENEHEMTVLSMNKSLSSAIIKDEYNFSYIEYIKNILFSELSIENKEILVLGAGGFTVSYNAKKNNNFTYVDIDPKIKKVAEKYFLKSTINGQFIAEDARVYIKNTQKKYDVIIVDLYTSNHSTPWHVITKEFMNDINEATVSGGNIVLNIIATKNFDDEYSKTIHNTITSTFDYCYVIPLFLGSYETEKINLEYFCRKTEKENKHIYIDDISRSALDEF